MTRRERRRSVTLEFEAFAWQSINEEAAREGLTLEEFVTSSILYYLADVDSGRIARQAARAPHPRRRSTDMGR